MKLDVKPIVSESEEERIANLGEYFDGFLFDWFTMLATGVRSTPGVQRELARSLIKHAALAMIASTDEAAKESDDQTEERCMKVADEMLEVLERHIALRRVKS